MMACPAGNRTCSHEPTDHEWSDLLHGNYGACQKCRCKGAPPLTHLPTEAMGVADRLAVAVARTALGAEADDMTDVEAVRTYDVRQRRGQSA